MSEMAAAMNDIAVTVFLAVGLYTILSFPRELNEIKRMLQKIHDDLQRE